MKQASQHKPVNASCLSACSSQRRDVETQRCSHGTVPRSKYALLPCVTRQATESCLTARWTQALHSVAISSWPRPVSTGINTSHLVIPTAQLDSARNDEKHLKF